MTRLSGGQAIVDSLERHDVDVTFGIPGVHTLSIYDALVDSDVGHVTARHEQGAGFMADGYARTTGRVGVALVITGPGLTNAATPIGQAYSDSSPLLVISSTNETTELGRGRGHLHELKDQSGLMENLVAYSERVERVGDVHRAVADAFEYLRTHRPRPVHIEVPMDVLERVDSVDPVGPVDAAAPTPDAERIAEAADLLADADRPLLVVGGGASGAASEVRELVDRAKLPIVSTVAGKGVVPADHDLFVAAGFRDDDVREFIASRDATLAVGTELSPQDTRDADFPAPLVHVDIDYTNFGKNYDCDVGVVGDAREAVGELLAALDERLDDGPTYGVDDVRVDVDSARPPAIDDSDDDRHRILAALRESLADDDVVVGDMTKLCYEATRRFPSLEPDTFLFPRGFGTLGFSPPTAFGARVGLDEADGDRNVVALVGDGGVMFTVQALATAVKYGLSVPVVVLNDECYGVVRDVQEGDYGRSTATDIANPDFLDMAESFGAAARRVEMADVETDLEAALGEAFEREGPTLVEIPVDF